MIILSILIVNYNGRHLLENCLNSVANFVCNDSVEVILVDNASNDGSADLLQEKYPWVKLVCSDENLGFTGGNNLAAQHAMGEFLLLLNTDTVLQNPLQPMLDIMTEFKKVGAVGCHLAYGDGRLQESMGYAHTPLRLCLSWSGLGNLFKHVPLFRRSIDGSSDLYCQHITEVAWVCGACLLTRRALWEALGGFDERYFMYVEDVDYCKRVTLAGYNVVYSDAVSVIHFEGGGRVWVGQRALLNTMRSYLIYTRKFYGVGGSIVVRVLLTPIMLARALGYAVLSVFTASRGEKEKRFAYLLAALRVATGCVDAVE